MDEIIVAGTMAAAACPGFLEQDGEFFAPGGGDYGEGGSGGTQEAEADEIDETPVAPEGGDPAEEPRRQRRGPGRRSEEHTSELPVTLLDLVCRLLLEKSI